MPTAAGTETPDTVCIPDETSLPDGPFTSLRYHFGMLLGEDDFRTEQRYHRSKMRLHNAWLHRAGVDWGFRVEPVLDRRELRVWPGLALDPTGRELHLDVLCCLDVGAWYDEHEDEVEATDLEGAAEGVRFDAHVQVGFCGCATRAVPSIADPCEGSGSETDTAFSRTFETVEIRLVPGLAPQDPPPYPRLRLLFGLTDGVPEDLADRADVLAARDALLSVPPDERANELLRVFRELAALDTVAAEPARAGDGDAVTPFPGSDEDAVVVANVGAITLEGTTGNWELTSADVDLAPRRSHVATGTIQELLCGSGLEVSVPDAGGPRAQQPTLDRGARTIVLQVSEPLDPQSVAPAAFEVSYFGSTGWRTTAVTPTPAPDALGVTLTLADDPGSDLVRLIARGTGPQPVLGADRVPLAGGTTSPAGTAADGHDFVHVFT
jgi:hypothetical protein